MSETESLKATAREMMAAPPAVENKLNALDALDRLALNPEGWFPDRLLSLFTDARIAIIVDRYKDANRTLEGMTLAISKFVESLSNGPAQSNGLSIEDAMRRAKAELLQVELVAAWVRAESKKPRPKL